MKTLQHTLVVLVLLGLSTFAQAAFFCVGSAADIANAITTASNSAADDDIRIQTGSYNFTADVDRTIQGNLTISGGWAAGCALRSSSASVSTLVGGNREFRLRLDSENLDLERLVYSDWDVLSISDFAAGIFILGTIDISRCRFTDARLNLPLASHNLRIENSLFDDFLSDAIRLTKSGSARPEALFQFNTIILPANTADGLELTLAPSAMPFERVRIYNTVISGTSRDLNIGGQTVLARYSLWNTQSLSSGAAFDPASGNNLSGDPQIALFRPVEPSSPLINSGINLVGESPATDFGGGVRRVGTRPDIGAFESSVNNSSTITVTSTADSGSGSLRAAITAANTNPGFKRIEFNLAGGCPGNITLSTPLPAVLEPVEIDGYSQTGSAENQATDSFDGTVCIFLLGAANNIATGLHLSTQSASDEMTVRGLGFYSFGSEGVRISGPGRGQVSGSLFNTGANIISPTAFADSAIRVLDAPESTIGGPNRGDRNVIGGGAQAGIRLQAATARRSVQNNFIGLARSGTTALRNFVGVLIEGGVGDQIFKNNIAYNDTHGIVIDGGSGVSVSSNTIGRGFGSPSVGGNGSNGIRILAGSNHRILRNTINNSGTDGLVVLSSSRANELSQNAFRDSMQQAIDLSPDGVNPIDLDVEQTGANDQQNYPTVLSARGSNSQGEVRLTLASANGTYRVQLYASAACANANGSSSAEVFVGEVAGVTLSCATPALNCSEPITVQISDALIGDFGLLGRGITAIAIDEEGNTSEVSACRAYELGDNLFRSGFEG